MLEINTMNFCSFSHCPASPGTGPERPQEEMLVAVPNTLASEAVSAIYSATRGGMGCSKIRNTTADLLLPRSIFSISPRKSVDIRSSSVRKTAW